MWVYVRSEPQLYTVGFYAPSGTWHTDSDHGTKEEAGERVHYLNGGSIVTKKSPQSKKKDAIALVSDAQAEASKKRFAPPTIEDVAQYCRERGNGIDSEQFCDYYAARGWVLSNGKKMVDWKSAVRTWEKRNEGTGKPAQTKGNTFLELLREGTFSE